MLDPRRTAAVCLVLAWAASLCPRPVGAQVGTTFTYQGRLTDATAPANGAYDLQFTLWDQGSGGSQQGPVVLRDDVAVANGLFTVSLDFGGVFTGSRRFLEIAVRQGASTGTFTPLSGRQELTPGPNAVYGSRAAWTGLVGMPAGFADGVDNDSGGDITDVTAGTGLSGGGTGGAVALAVAFSGPGTAPFASRFDHHHFGSNWSGTATNQGLNLTNSLGSGLRATGGSTGFGVDANGGTAVRAIGTSIGVAAGGSTIGVSAQATGSGATRGVVGDASSSAGIGVYGSGATGVGGFGITLGVSGVSTGTTGTSAGVYGAASATGPTGGATGVWGVAAAATSYAGYFSSRVHVNGTLSKSAGSFKIDHPLDPENKYLSHSFVESPDMMNVYNGNVVLDADGQADVALPDWFEALNQDFRYQLTAIGGPGPGLHVAREITANRFRIGGGSPGLKVSWQVTGIRHDAYAAKHRIAVEEVKPEYERGVYLQPEAHGLPAERGLDHRRRAPHLDETWGKPTAQPVRAE